jgi:8-oxo-dGTP diphosphatase / 2-hydroxy-dATP diphosphatase
MEHPKPTKIMTLGLVYNHPDLLLGLKKTGFGKGRWNGFGGKVKNGEMIEDGLVREFQEECGIKPTEYFKQGIIYFQFENDPEILEVNFFNISKYEGEPIETEEMKPQWFNVDDIPFDQMWPDDPLWFPLFLAGKKFEGNVFFKDQDTIIRHDIREL